MNKKSVMSCLVILCLLGPVITPNMGVTTAQEEQPRYGGTIITGLTAEPSTLLFTIWLMEAQHITCQIQEGLVEIDYDGNVCPCLAESWELSEDKLDITFHLIENATWHDGVPFTSADVKYTFEDVIITVGQKAQWMNETFEPIADTPDNQTVVFHLKSPNPDMLSAATPFTNIFFTIMPKHLYEGTDVLTNPYNDAPVGTGPFKFVEWKRGSYVRLERNNNYWRKGLPYLDEIIVKFFPDVSAVLAAIEAKEFDFIIRGVPPEQIARLEAEYSHVDIIKWVYVNVAENHLAFNVNDPILSDVDVRHAIAHALNITEISEIASLGVDQPIKGFIEYYVEPETTYDFDVDTANQLLDDAGYAAGGDGVRFTLDLWYRTDYQLAKEYCELIKDQLERNVGIDVVLQPAMDTVFFETVGTNLEHDMVWVDCALGPTPANLYQYFANSRIGVGAFGNYMGYSNAELDELMLEGQSEFDLETRKTIFSEVQEIIMSDLPAIPFIYGTRVAYVNNEFHGLPADYTYRGNYKNVWWDGGSIASPEAAWDAIEKAEGTIESLAKQFYDVTEANEKLEEAKQAYEAGDYEAAMALAGEAEALAKPPMLLYIGIGVVIVVLVAAVVLYWRKRKTR